MTDTGTNITDMTHYDQEDTYVIDTTETIHVVNGQYCLFRYENPMADIDTNTKISNLKALQPKWVSAGTS